MADLYEIDERTVERYLVNHRDELEENGYEVLSGKRLSDLKEALSDAVRETKDGTDTNVGTIRDTLKEVEGIKRTSVLGVFTFKALLNIGMLLTESQKANT